jgi:two-component system sensor histidine kinase TctE
VKSTRTLRAQLLRWLFIPLSVLCAAGAWHAQVTVRRAVDAAYDRPLYASALAIAEHVMLNDGQPVVDLPPVALEMLDTEDQDRVFYCVSVTGPDGDTFVTGYRNLPTHPAPMLPGKPVFYEAPYRGDTIRIAALSNNLRADGHVTVMVQVAETLAGRIALTRAIVARTLLSQLILVAIGAAIVWFGVTRGLRPLTALSREVERRTATELAPLEPRGVPHEVWPLVEAINQLIARVREAMGTQRRFIADASHQLRTPLAVLRTQADFALREDDPAAMKRAVAQLRDHSQATSHLASQLLSLARAEPVADQSAIGLVDLTEVAREACSALVPEALARHADLGFDGADPAKVRGEAYLVREMVANLVDNALRYGRPGVEITVSVGRGVPGWVWLAVEDDGPGIPEAQRSRVLERFYRIPGTPGDGAGLGLSIVHEIARNHRATVHLSPGRSGRGLRVEVRFPEALSHQERSDVRPDRNLQV